VFHADRRVAFCAMPELGTQHVFKRFVVVTRLDAPRKFTQLPEYVIGAIAVLPPGSIFTIEGMFAGASNAR
jgi:hypothetical protein